MEDQINGEHCLCMRFDHMDQGCDIFWYTIASEIDFDRGLNKQI